MSKTYIKGYEYTICTHPQGPDSGVFAPELCCPDNLCEYGPTTIVDCNSSCPHHKNHKKE